MITFFSTLLGGILTLIGSFSTIFYQKHKEKEEKKEHIYIQFKQYFDKLVRFKESTIDTLNLFLNSSDQLKKCDFSLINSKEQDKNLNLQQLKLLRQNHKIFLDFIWKNNFYHDQSNTKTDVYKSQILYPIKIMFNNNDDCIKISFSQADNIFLFIRYFKNSPSLYFSEQHFKDIKLIKNMLDHQQNLHVLNKEEYEIFIWLQNTIDSIVIDTLKSINQNTRTEYMNEMNEHFFILCIILDELFILINKNGS